MKVRVRQRSMCVVLFSVFAPVCGGLKVRLAQFDEVWLGCCEQPWSASCRVPELHTHSTPKASVLQPAAACIHIRACHRVLQSWRM